MNSLNTTIGSNLGFNAPALPKNNAGAKDSSSVGASSIGSGALAGAFTQILEQSINGLTTMAAQVATKRVAEFAEDHDAFRMFLQAAGWAPTDSSTSRSSSSSSSSSSTSGASSTSNPISILLSALGQEVISLIENSLPDFSNSESSSGSTTKSNGGSNGAADANRAAHASKGMGV